VARGDRAKGPVKFTVYLAENSPRLAVDRYVRLEPTRILLIEDNPIWLELASSWLDEWGYSVVAAEDGSKGLELFNLGGIDLVVSDLGLPDMSGFELLERIHQRSPEIPVILLSAETDTAAVIGAIHQGVSDFVAKSERPSLLQAAIKRALDRLRLARENLELIGRLRDVNNMLEAQVLERTRALQEANLQLKAEIDERQHMELELRLAQKLEAVGQLAAGIAHEINTPMQYIGDSVYFLRDAFAELVAAFSKLESLCASMAEVPGQHSVAEATGVLKDADIRFLQSEAPKALERTLDGVGRVTTIVRALKEFAHPDHHEKDAADLNKAVTNALTVSRNEYKYVADVEVDLGDLPLVMCHVGEVNQVLLNLIVNAAHAIGEVVGNTGKKGVIRVQTQVENEMALIRIADTGCGIPDSIRERLFDPFFTTKPVGKGTGQGLAIARSIIIDRHHGALEFESTLGCGTAFTIRLPIAVPQEAIESV
jgi:signal transduction histidine kinase